MKAILFGAMIFGSFVIAYASCNDEGSKKEQKLFKCSNHTDCLENTYCYKKWLTSYCQRLPICQFPWSKCPQGTSCNSILRYCVRPEVRYCIEGTECDTSTECCSIKRLGYGLGFCKKRRGEGESCCPKSRNPCDSCSVGLECKSNHLGSPDGKCQVISATTPPSTEPGSERMK